MTTALETIRDIPFTIGGRSFQSRLMVGTGKYRDNDTMARAIDASGAEIVTVAVRRVDLDRTKEEGVLYHLDAKRYFLLANTAGCYTAEDAIRYARLAREAGFNEFIKLEVIGDQETLLPDVQGLLVAARTLVAEGFKVLAYTNEDLVTALRLEDAGCAAVMPLASPIGSGLGLLNPFGVRTIKRRLQVPVAVDAGGARRRWDFDEHGARRGAGSRRHGPRHATGRRGRAHRLPRRPHGQARGGDAVLAAGRDVGLRTPRPPGARHCRCSTQCARVPLSRAPAMGRSEVWSRATAASLTNWRLVSCAAAPSSTGCSSSRPPIPASTTCSGSGRTSCAR